MILVVALVDYVKQMVLPKASTTVRYLVYKTSHNGTSIGNFLLSYHHRTISRNNITVSLEVL